MATNAQKRIWATRMSRNKTPAEKRLWYAMKDKQLGVPVHAQKIVCGWIADFWCPKAKLVIEVDGGYHNSSGQRAHDNLRDAVMRRKGISVIRFKNEEVMKNLPAVLALIRDRINKRQSNKSGERK